MSVEENKAIVGRWFTEFWGPDFNPGVIDELAVGQWIGGGTQTGAAFDDMPVGALPAGTGKAMRFTGTTILKVEDGLITEEIGLDDGVTVLQQLGLITAAPPAPSATAASPARQAWPL
jgi:hypothetical protein